MACIRVVVEGTSYPFCTCISMHAQSLCLSMSLYRLSVPLYQQRMSEAEHVCLITSTSAHSSNGSCALSKPHVNGFPYTAEGNSCFYAKRYRNPIYLFSIARSRSKGGNASRNRQASNHHSSSIASNLHRSLMAVCCL